MFGGSAQFLVAEAIAVTGDTLAPAWYMSGGVLVGLVAMLMLRETAPNRTGPSTGASPAGAVHDREPPDPVLGGGGPAPG